MSLGIAGICDKPALPLGLRYTGAVDGEAVLFLYPSANLLVGRHICFKIKFALVVVCVDYEGEPGSVHRQTGFGNGVRIPNVCLSLTKKMQLTIFGFPSVSMLYNNDFHTICYLDIAFKLSFILNLTKSINNKQLMKVHLFICCNISANFFNNSRYSPCS